MCFSGNRDARRLAGANRHEKARRPTGTLCFLLEIGAHDLDDVVGGFLGRFGRARHVIADMVLEELTHKAINRPPSGCQALEYLRARRILLQGSLNRLELTDDLLGAIEKIQFFPGPMRHVQCATLAGYTIQAPVAAGKCFDELKQGPAALGRNALRDSLGSEPA